MLQSIRSHITKLPKSSILRGLSEAQNKTSEVPKAAWLGLAAASVGAGLYSYSRETPPSSLTGRELLSAGGTNAFDHVVVGGGSAGCVGAYLFGRWLEREQLPGKVLLIDGGPGYETSHPKLSQWYDNWGQFGRAHESYWQNHAKQEPYPVVASEHRGVGGAGSHDTRIFFTPTPSERAQYADALGMSQKEFETYMQAALNLEPIVRASEAGEAYFDQVIDCLAQQGLQRGREDRFFGEVLPNSVAYFDVGAFGEKGEDLRWCSALLVHDPEIKPKPLEIAVNTEVIKLVFSEDGQRVEGLLVRQGDQEKEVRLKGQGQVTLAAGALGTPGILQRSGIGPEKVLQEAGVGVFVVANEVGHGVDHEEIAVSYAAPKNFPGGAVPKGGMMGWALGIFKDLEGLDRPMQAHFSISGPPYNSELAVVGTPNTAKPDLGAGFRVAIKDQDPLSNLELTYQVSPNDQKTLLQGVRSMVELFESLRAKNLVGERLEPPAGLAGIDLKDSKALWDWIFENKGTAYHWLCTCKAGLLGKVQTGASADERFRLRMGTDAVKTFENLFISSGAALPFPPTANPHVTIQSFAVAQTFSAYQLWREAHGFSGGQPEELRIAQEQWSKEKKLTPRAPGEEVPATLESARRHYAAFRQRV